MYCVQAEADMVAHGVDEADITAVKSYARDLRNLLEESDYTERKGFLRSFAKRVEVDKTDVTVRYKLPLPPDDRSEDRVPVLPIDILGGPSHVLPTGGTARFSSPLNISDFVRFMNLGAVDKGDLKQLGQATVTIARAEGFEAHARAVEKRLS